MGNNQTAHSNGSSITPSTSDHRQTKKQDQPKTQPQSNINKSTILPPTTSFESEIENSSDVVIEKTIPTLNNNNLPHSSSSASFSSPTLIGESKILIGESGKSITQQLRASLPHEQKQFNEWTLLYANWKNGASIATFAEIVMHHGAMIIIIEDIEGNVFGAFTSVSLEKKPNFYGNSNCLLFKIVDSEENNEEKIVKIFRSSNKNENYVYFNYGNKYNPYNGLAFGGKMGCFSLCIEEDWRFGRTVGDLLTYSYSPQLSNDSDFEINHIEAWIFPLSESIQIDLRYRAKAKQSKQALGEDNAAEIFIMKQAGVMSSDNDHIRETAYQKDSDLKNKVEDNK